MPFLHQNKTPFEGDTPVPLKDVGLIKSGVAEGVAKRIMMVKVKRSKVLVMASDDGFSVPKYHYPQME